jgi:7-cyano-7-deazaguanine synthase in queuosine biosynthesis
VSAVQLRTEPGQPDVGADILLDWFEDRAASTIQYGSDFLKALAPSAVALDLLRLAGAVFCADKILMREEADDFWTRDIEIRAPVSDVGLWEGVTDLLVQALTFLSGDRWRFEFVDDTARTSGAESMPSEHDAVALFSGGLDSLAGAIDLLASGRRVVLVGHHDSSLTANKQGELFRALRERYGADRVSLRELLLRPAAPSPIQRRPLPSEGGENTTRSRSFLFLAAGVAAADALGAEVPLVVPENGFIGINVPLSPARAGSLSTRTTHPLFMHRMQLLLERLGIGHGLENPYRLLTKGEALAASQEGDLLAELAPRTISCSHPEAPRWRKRPQGNCGYCYPCLIRRASLYRIGLDRSADYSWDALTEVDLLGRESDSGASLRALAQSLGRPESPTDVLVNGRIPNGEAPAFYETYRRGRIELRKWLMSGAGPELRRRLGAT